MIGVSIAFRGLKAYGRHLTRAEMQFRRKMLANTRQAAKLVAREMKSGVVRRTGRLMKAIGYDVKLKGSEVHAWIGPETKKAWYGHLVEGGAGPHSIPGWGHDHPGAKAQPYMGPALKRTEQEQLRLMGRTFQLVA